MQSKRILSATLAILMLAVGLTACGKTPESIDETNSQTTTSSKNETEADPVEDALTALRGNVNWGGEDFGILYTNDFFGYSDEVEAVAELNSSSNSRVINDAVFERNTLFEEYCDLTFVKIPVSSQVASTRLRAEAQTATGDFELVTMKTRDTAASATVGLLYNYLDLNIDYEQAWWDQGTLDFALDGRIFFMNGPFNMVDDNVTFVMMFNKELRTRYQNRIEDPYKTVENGEWTLSYFNSVIADMAAEDGDGDWDEHDTYGFSTPATIGDSFFYGAGLRYVINNRDMDVPELVLSEKMEQALDVLAIARSIVHENNSSYVAPDFMEDKAKNVFLDGRALFYCEVASYLGAMNAGMEGEGYGVLPLPKYNEEQEKYITWIHSSGSTLSIPTSVVQNDIAQFESVLETYVLLSQKLVKPAFYDTLLTTRNVQDVESSEMLDMIFQNRTYDMAIYFEDLGFANLFAKSVLSDGTDFSSQYKATSKNFDRNISSILRKLQKSK